MISAIILAAGQSKRMGQPKMALRWGKVTVIEKVVVTFREAGVVDIRVITGDARDQVEGLVGRTVKTIFNPDYQSGEMLSSVQVGLTDLNSGVEAAIIGLGDQPQVQVRSVKEVMEAYQKLKAPIIIPSFKKRRGHPWLVTRSHWNAIMEMRSPESLRDFLNRHESDIHYIEFENESILQDLDSPEDYRNSKP